MSLFLPPALCVSHVKSEREARRYFFKRKRRFVMSFGVRRKKRRRKRRIQHAVISSTGVVCVTCKE